MSIKTALETSHSDPLQAILAALYGLKQAIDAALPYACPNCHSRLLQKIECPKCGYNWRMDRMATVERERSTGEVK